MRTPYDNGKIKMGSNYNPDLRPTIDDPDMLLLQTALIGNTVEIRRQKALNILYVAVVAIVLFGLFVFN